MVKKATRLAIQAKERAEIEEIEKSRQENNLLRANSGHWMSSLVMGVIVSLVPVYLYCTPIFDIDVSTKLPFFIVGAIVSSAALSGAYSSTSYNTRVLLSKTGEVLEQIEVLESVLSKEEAQSTVYARLQKQSELYASFVVNSLYLISYFSTAFFLLRPYGLTLHVCHLVSSVMTAIFVLLLSKIIR